MTAGGTSTAPAIIDAAIDTDRASPRAEGIDGAAPMAVRRNQGATRADMRHYVARGADGTGGRMTPAAPRASSGGRKCRGKPMRRLVVTAIAALSVCAVASCANPSPPSATAGFGPTGAVA